MVLGALLALGHRAEEDAEKEIAAVVNAWACNLESICSPTTTRESKESIWRRETSEPSVFREEKAGRDAVPLNACAAPFTAPFVPTEPMEIPPSLRDLFQGGHEKYAIVDAHQMRHSAWGSPEGIMLIDSAGCAACSRPTGWIAQPPCHVLTLCACVAIGAASAQPPRRASRDRTGWRQ